MSYQQVAPRSPALAAIASFLLPGLGQFINGQVGKGVIALVAYGISWLLTTILIGFLMLPVVVIWAIVDAYRSAQRWNRDHGILS